MIFFEKDKVPSNFTKYYFENPLTLQFLLYRIYMHPIKMFSLWACTGFDRDLEDGEAIRRKMRQIANLKLNANDNFELAAA